MGGKKKASGDAGKGEKIFKNLCAVCHSLSAHSTGPALGGVAGSAIASQSGFAYSAALSSKATQKWTDATLDKWIKSPADFAPGMQIRVDFVKETLWLLLEWPLERIDLTSLPT